jgi:hypothetical protein
VPTSIVYLVDNMATYFGTKAAGALWAMQWLEQLPVGAATGELPHRIALELLGSDVLERAIDGDAWLLEFRASMIKAYSAYGAGTPESASLTEACQMLKAKLVSALPERKPLISCLAEAASIDSEEDALNRTFGAVSIMAGVQARMRCRMTGEEERDFEVVMNQIAEELIADGKSPYDARKVAEQRMPERWEQFHDARVTFQAGMRSVGQAFAGKLMEYTAALGR